MCYSNWTSLSKDLICAWYEKRWLQENDKLDWPPFDFWWLFSLVLTRPSLGSLELVAWPRIIHGSWASALRAPGDSNQAKKRARTWTASNYPSFRTSGFATGEPITRGARGRSARRPGNTSTWAHKFDWILAWKAEMIMWDNQAFSLLMLKKKAVYGNEVWGESRNPENHSTVTPPKTSHGCSEHTFSRIYDSDALLGGLSTCFMTATIRGDISSFMYDTYNRENASFLPPASWLMSESLRCEIPAEFQAGYNTRFDKRLNLGNYWSLNIYDKSTLHSTV